MPINEEKTTIIISHEDLSECMKDQENYNNRRPKGYVEIFEEDSEGKRKFLSKSNIIVYQCRELAAQRMINIQNPNLPLISNNEFICWFGLGDGGADIGDPLTPLVPLITDNNLSSEVPITPNTDITATDLRGSDFYKLPLDDIGPSNEGVIYLPDSSHGGRYLKVQLQITVDFNDAVGQNLNEAGLFSASSNSPGSGNTGPWHLMARITFPTTAKTNTRKIIFVWYLYF